MTHSSISASARRLKRTRPTLEHLEGRSLMATAGALDPTFGLGTGAYQVLANSNGTGASLASFGLAAVELDGSVVVAGPTSSSVEGLLHLKANGTLDTSFGTGGEATQVLPTGVTTYTASTALLVQPDGKILLAGEGFGGTTNLPGFLVTRFNANGSLDTTFGTGGSVVQNATTLGAGDFKNGVEFAALQSDGKIVLVGTVPTSPAGTSFPGFSLTAARLNADGTVDTSFGNQGQVNLTNDTTFAFGALGLSIQPNGQIVIASASETVNSQNAAIDTPELIRLNADGSVDSSLSQVGIQSSGINLPVSGTIPPIANSLIVQPDGKILVLGLAVDGKTPVLARVNADGTLDKTTVPFGGLTYLANASLAFALQPNGDVALSLAPVNIDSSGNGFTGVVRLTPNLTLDPTFGKDGIVNLSIASSPGSGAISSTSLIAANIGIAPGNRIVLAGQNYFSQGSGNPSVTYDAAVRLTSTGSAIPDDFTGDRIADPTIYLPSNSAFVVRPSQGGADQVSLFGLAGAGQTIPTPGDFTGSGQDDIAAYLPSLGEFAYRPPTGPDVLVPFGLAGSGQTLPAIGDYFGTGQDDIAAYLPSLGEFAIRNPAGGADEIIPFGIAGAGQSIPVPGDYDGSGKTELAVYLPSLGAFAYRPANGGADVITYFGLAGTGNTIPTPGDYTGSGKTEIAVYLPSLGEFVYRPANGGADVAVPFGIAGAGQTIPMPADYTGSGKTEIAAYFPSLGVFAYRPAGGGPDVVEPFGASGAGNTIPVTGASASVVPGVVPSLETGSVSAMSLEVPNVVATDLPGLISAGSARKHANQ